MARNESDLISQTALARVDAAMAQLSQARRTLQAKERPRAAGSDLPAGVGERHKAFDRGELVEPRAVDDAWVSVDEAARMLELSDEQVRRNLRTGRMPGIPYGGRIGWRLGRAYVEAEAQRRKSGSGKKLDLTADSNDVIRLVLAAFPEANRAGRALKQLETDLAPLDAAVIRHAREGEVTVREAPRRAGMVPLAAAIAQVVVPALAGVAMGASMGLVVASLLKQSRWSTGLKRLGATVDTPETSALVLLVQEGHRVRTEQFLLDAGGYVASAGFDTGLVKRIEKEFGTTGALTIS